MLKTRVVLDAGVIVSFLLTRGEAISSIFNFWDAGKFELLVSEDILAEIVTVLGYEKIAKLVKPWEAQALLEKLRLEAELVNVETKLNVISDPKDNKYLECAVDGGADFVVSGDKHLLDLKEFKGIKILIPGDFLYQSPRSGL